mgnify:FL=1|tara:strand:- start:367 stop:1698 length:1332 start_codon:yes stop_codon:yes gene_type:complete
MKRKLTINEELNRMKGLMSYENGQHKNPIISEQNDDEEQNDDVTQLGKGRLKDNPDALYDEELYKPSSNIQKKIKKANPNFDSQLAELKKHPAYKLMVGRMDRNEDKIFFEILTQESRKVFLDKTLEFLRSFTNKKKLERKIKKDPNFTGIESKKLYNWSLDVEKGKLSKEKIPVEVVENIQSVELDIPLYVQGKTVYKDNSPEPAESLINEIKSWVSEVKNKVDEIKQNFPDTTAVCTEVDIASSCSRLRNTGAYEGKTWNELSKDRSEKVYEILTSQLNSIGVTVSPEITKVLRGGKNGNGSSGPDPANKFVFDSGKNTKKMRYSKDGAQPLSGPDKDRFVGEYGKLLDTQEESHQYKFCSAFAKIIVKAKSEGEEEPLQPETIYHKGFSILLNPTYKPIKFKGKPAKGSYKSKGGGGKNNVHGVTKRNKVKNNNTKCFVF